MTLEQKHALVGKFIAHFEQLVNDIRYGCDDILTLRGLKDQALCNIMFNQRAYTAENLFSVHQMMCNEILKRDRDNDSLREKISDFTNRAKKINEFRNELIHGRHFYNGELEEMRVMKFTPDKQGRKTQMVIDNPDSLINKINDLNNLLSEYMFLNREIWIVLLSLPDVPKFPTIGPETDM